MALLVMCGWGCTDTEVHIVSVLSAVQHGARSVGRRHDRSDVGCCREPVERRSSVDCSAAVCRHHRRSALRRRRHRLTVCRGLYIY